MPHNHQPQESPDEEAKALAEINAAAVVAADMTRRRVVRWLRSRAARLHAESIHETLYKHPFVAQRLIDEANAMTRAAADLELGVGWLE